MGKLWHVAVNRYKIAFPPGFLLGVTALSFSICLIFFYFYFLYFLTLHLRVDEAAGKEQACSLGRQR